jgi:hypothetical protein
MRDVDEVEARVREILNRWPAVGFAAGVVGPGGLEFFHGHGGILIPFPAHNWPGAQRTGR